MDVTAALSHRSKVGWITQKDLLSHPRDPSETVSIERAVGSKSTPCESTGSRGLWWRTPEQKDKIETEAGWVAGIS